MGGIDHERLLAHVDVGVFVVDVSRTVIYANEAMARLLATTREKLEGSRIDVDVGIVCENGSALPRGDLPMNVALRTGQSSRDVLGFSRSDGVLVWGLLTVSVDGEGDARRAICTLTEVGRIREAHPERAVHAALERSNARVRSLLDAMPAVLYEYELTDDGADRVRHVVGPARQIFGIEPEALMNGSEGLWSRIHPDDVTPVREAIARSAMTMTVVEHELRLFSDDFGGYRWLRLRGRPARQEQSLVWTGVALDITASRALEEQLRVAQRREAMAELAAGVAHNFNNMLAAIMPNLELALEEVAEETRPLLEDARYAAESAADLVRRLVALTRGTANAGVSTELVTITRRVAQLCRQTFDRAITIDVLEPPPRADVVGGESDHEQAILNLLLNARDALQGREGARIVLTIERLTERPGMVTVCVSDNGAGMDEATRRRLGEPFFTTKSPGRGTGLGLAMVFGTIRDLGGEVHCDSQVGVGTTFTLTIPSAPVPQGSAVPAPDAMGTATGRVLVVEDEALVRSTIARALRRENFQLVEAVDGQDALDRLEREVDTFDAVVLDLSLPHVPGRNVLAWIRARRPELPVVVLSGNIDLAALDPAPDATLAKPEGVADLARVLSSLISRLP